MVHYSWVFECCSQKKLLPLKPKHFLFLSGNSKKKLEEEIDEFSDSYFWDLELADLKQLLNNVSRSDDVKAIDYYRGKYCPKHEWCMFVGCQIYFLPLRLSLKSDSSVLLELSMRRLKVEVSFRGGKVSDDHVSATHIVVFSIPGVPVRYETVLKSCNEAEKHIMLKDKIHMVAYQWLEDSLERAQRLQEDAYSLNANRKKSIENINSGIDSETPSALENIDKQQIPSPSKEYKDRGRNEAASRQQMLSYSTERSAAKKRGRPATRTMQKGKSGIEQVRRVRTRTAKGPAKISQVESDSSDYTDDITNAETGDIGTLCSENSEKNKFKMLENEISNAKKRGRPTAGNTHEGTAGAKEVQRTRACIAKGSAKIDDIESVSSDRTDEKTNAEESNKEKEENLKMDEFKMLEDYDLKQKGKAIEENVRADSKSNVEFGKHLEVGISERYNVKDVEKSEKLEVMNDPLEAMLLDMVPSLGMSGTKSISSTVVEEKNVHNNSEPAKKKVSYKDVASELLKDW